MKQRMPHDGRSEKTRDVDRLIGSRRNLRLDDGCAANDGAVPSGCKHINRARYCQYQPGVRLRPTLVGPHTAVCGRSRRSPRCRSSVVHWRLPRGARHDVDTADDHNYWPHFCDWNFGRRRRRDGWAVGADGGDRAFASAGKTRNGHGHCQRRGFVRTVPDGPNSCRAHGDDGLDDVHANSWLHRVARAACGVGAQRQLERRCTARING